MLLMFVPNTAMQMPVFSVGCRVSDYFVSSEETSILGDVMHVTFPG